MKLGITPGPWKSVGQIVRDGTGVVVASTDIAHRSRTQNESNARAIAEVPAMIEALRNLADDCLIIAEGLNDYPPCTQPSIPRNGASRKLKQYAAAAYDVLSRIEGVAQ